MNLCSDIGKGGRDKLLIDLVEIHYFEFSSFARLDEMVLFRWVRDAAYDRLGERFEITAGLVQTSVDASLGRGKKGAQRR